MGKLNDWRSKPRGPRPDVAIRSKLLFTQHGLTDTPTFKSWDGMLQRVYNPRCKDYQDYGGRGIDVDPRWHKFIAFLGDMGIKPDGVTLGRINNELGYWPGNCRWETHLQQQNNKRSNRFIEHNEKRQTIAMWARELGVSRQMLRYRLEVGWTIQQVIETTPNHGNGWHLGRRQSGAQNN